MMKRIATFLLTIILVVCLFACDGCNVKAKDNPFISNPDNVFTSIKETVAGITYEYKVKNGELYLALKKDTGATSLMNLVDTYLLKSYYDAVTEEDIRKTIDKDVYGDEEEREELTDEEKEEARQEFLDTMFISYGCKETNIYGPSIQRQYRLSLAEKAYALEVLKEDIRKHTIEYDKYMALTDKEKKEAEDPVTAPYYSESKFAAKYNADNYSTFEAIIIPFTSERLASIALQAIGVVVNGDGVWADPDNGLALSAYEVLLKHIALYEYVYGYKATGLTFESEEFKFTESELTSLNASILNRIKNSMGTYKMGSSSNVNPDWYYATPYVTSSGSVHAYVLKLNEKIVKPYNDLSDAEKEAEKVKYLDDLYEDTLTSSFILGKMADLRAEKNLKIYDTVIELAYLSAISSFEAEYEKVKDEKASVVASVDGKEFTADELFVEMMNTYGLSALVDELSKQRFLGNPTLNPYYNVTTKQWLDTEQKNTIEEALKAEKKNFNNGVYKDYGYEKKTCTWQTFIEASYGVNSDDELRIYFLTEIIMNEYKANLNYIAYYTGTSSSNYTFKISEEAAEASALWKTLQAKMQEEVDKYFSVKGIHLLICSYESVSSYIAGGSIIDPEEWTEEQRNKAIELYDEIIAYLNDSKGTYQEKFQKIVDAFKVAPSADRSFMYNGSQVATTLVSDGGNATIQISLYKGYGLYVKYEELGTFTNGQMVEAFNDAVKDIWNQDRKDNKTERITLAKNVIETQFGYHIYVNLASSALSYIDYSTVQVEKTDENGEIVVDDKGDPVMENVEVYRYLPTLREIRAYTLNTSDSSLKPAVKTAITKYYSPYINEITGDNYTYAARFYQLKALSNTLSVLGDYTKADFDRYIDLYIDFTFEQYLSKVTTDFLE